LGGTGVRAIEQPVKLSAWAWLFLTVVVMVFGTVLCIFTGPDDRNLPYLIDAGKRVVTVAILVGVPTLRSAYRVPEKAKEPPNAILWLIRTGALSVALIVVERLSSMFIARPLTEQFPDSALFAFPQYANDTIRLLDLTVGMFLVGLSEELLFRRALIEMLLKQSWPRLAVVFGSAVPFACIHWYGGIGHVIYALPFGLFAALIYLQFRSLWMLVVIHAAADLFVFGYFDPR
jgi:membrane protease YdiL (CAAX protease family)